MTPFANPRASARTALFVPGAVAALVASLAATPTRSVAQTDYYNTDTGRPVQIEDALALERYGLEFQAAPFRVERRRGGFYTWGVEPELAYGILPRTQLEVGLPVAFVDAGLDGRTSGLAGVDVSVLHNLNTETAIPALAISASVLAPAGGLGPERAYPSLKGIATKTFSWARFHANAQYTFGDRIGEDARGAGAAELSQWLAGVAVDRTFPLRSVLLTGEVYAQQPLREDEDVVYTVGTGLRYQVDPRWALDAGVGRRLTGDEQGWSFTFGTAYAFGLRGLFPVSRR